MTIVPEKEIVSRIAEVAKTAEQATDATAWRAVLEELQLIAVDLGSQLDRNSGRSTASIAKISTRCNPKLAKLIRAEADAVGEPPSRLVAEAVRELIAHPPPADAPIWRARQAVVRSLMGRATLTAAVDTSMKQAFEEMIPRVSGVANKSQLLAWVLWHSIGCPRDRG